MWKKHFPRVLSVYQYYQLIMFINFYQKSNKISLLTFNSQATLCCLSGIQAPPKNAEVLEHVAGNEYFVFLILDLFPCKIKFILFPKSFIVDVCFVIPTGRLYQL